jgi:hypothetical protein
MGLSGNRGAMKYWTIENGKPVERDVPGPDSTTGIGLGDVVAGATKAVGVKPCGSCQKRQAAMNKATPKWMTKMLGWLRS